MQSGKFVLAFLATLLASQAAPVSAQGMPDPAATWKVPADAVVTIDRKTGRTSILMPREIADRAGGDMKFADWRSTPYAGTGPTPATRVDDPTLPSHTLYYPAELVKSKQATALPVVLWANGGCRNTSVEFTRFLGELASRGYFIVAVGRNDVPFALFNGRDPEPAAGAPPLQIRGGEIVIAGLDWIAKETARKGSPYYRKVDVSKVAALGQSCGGGQVWAASRDARVNAVAALNSNFPSATSGTGPGGAPPSDGWTVDKLKIPAAYFIGGPGDSAYVPSLNSYASTPASATVIKANFPLLGHTGAYKEPHPEWVLAVSSWLDWQLKGDAKGKAMFAGADCGLCRNGQWWYESKNVN